MCEVAEQQEGPAVADQVEGDGDGAALLVAVTHDVRLLTSPSIVSS
jgi:hypothetical protein